MQDGSEAYVTVAVPADTGKIHAMLRGVAIELEPEDITKLRSVFAEAQAQALMDRGFW